HKIIALKSFFAYLRDGAGLLSKFEDRTRDLKVPQGKPEQQKRVKAIPHGDFLKVRKLLDGESRDALDVLARTGWHVTELVRFTNGGEVLPVRDGRAKGGRCGSRARSVATRRWWKCHRTRRARQSGC